MSVTATTALLLFRLDAQRFALPVAAVERVVRAAAVTPLPDAPAIVLGVVDVQGRLWPVVDVRRRFGAPSHEIRPSDLFLLAHAASHAVILVIDDSDGVVEHAAAEIIASDLVVPGADTFPGAVILPDGVVWIHDLDTFLSLDEVCVLDAALTRASEAWT